VPLALISKEKIDKEEKTKGELSKTSKRDSQIAIPLFIQKKKKIERVISKSSSGLSLV